MKEKADLKKALKTRNNNKFLRALPTWVFLLALLGLWQVLVMSGRIPAFILPSPYHVLVAMVGDVHALLHHSGATLTEAFIGLGIGLVLGFTLATGMLFWKPLYRMLYPVIIITQTIPSIALAPLLVLWMGFGMAPKIALVVLTTFFPITIGLYEGLCSADRDEIMLLRSMGASRMQIFRYVELPASLDSFFAALKISLSYSVIAAVVAEWMGGMSGLGVYMQRVRKAYDFRRMFAVIILVSIISLLLMALIVLLKKRVMPWLAVERTNDHEE